MDDVRPVPFWVKFNTRQCHSDRAFYFHTLLLNLYVEMLDLCQIAFRVMAAIKAYNSVRDFTDRADWVEGLNDELVSAHLCKVLTQCLDRLFFFQIESCCSQYLGALQRYWGSKSRPPIHHILVALSIVLNQNEDLSRVTTTHPDRDEHMFYDPSADFSKDILDLASRTKSCWWEPLGKPQFLIHLHRSTYNL